MAEQDTFESLAEFKLSTTQELIDAYMALSDEGKAPVHERATHLRFGPTGMNDGEAILAAMAEKMSADPETPEA